MVGRRLVESRGQFSAPNVLCSHLYVHERFKKSTMQRNKRLIAKNHPMVLGYKTRLRHLVVRYFRIYNPTKVYSARVIYLKDCNKSVWQV